jgi:hypothetical protein
MGKPMPSDEFKQKRKRAVAEEAPDADAEEIQALSDKAAKKAAKKAARLAAEAATEEVPEEEVVEDDKAAKKAAKKAKKAGKTAAPAAAAGGGSDEAYREEAGITVKRSNKDGDGEDMEAPACVRTLADAPFDAAVIKAFKAAGFSEPSPIQASASFPPS